MESRKSVQNLAKSIRSLLGLKTHLTSSWADSVCNIARDLPSEEPSNSSQIKCVDFYSMGSSDNKEVDLGVSVSKIQDELAASNSYLNQLNLQRRQALNDFLDLKGNIRVFCRVRPIIIGENVGRFGPVVASDSSNVLLKIAESKSKAYSFDKVFHPGSSQDEVFAEVEPVIKSALDGYNTCIFAYGQTGTGKTFTMEGTADCLGVVPRAIEALFKQALDSNHAFLFSFSMLEIYMGSLKDLLVPQSTKPTEPLPPCLSIQTDPRGGIEIDNLVTIRVSDFNQAIRLYRLGSRFRSTASTNSNVTSSRSHCLIRISLTCFNAPERRRETSKLWMVDLGGSERVLKTKAWGRRLEEGKAINLSLSALGDVISALQRRKAHIPYRNSKLTRVLKDSLGEDSKMLMLVHVSPKEEDLCETICSLNFATRVRNIHLENEESTEVRNQKEVAMTKLLQKVKQIEYERQDIRRNIDKLNEKLQHLTRTVPPSNEHLKPPHLSNEVPQSNTEMENHSIGDVIATPSAQLPRFMRPTICSRRKSGTDPKTLESAQKKDSFLSRRRKPSSVHAESITFPIKGILEYDSECSTSRTSCLVGLNMKCSTDYGTEYSQDASECDIKTVVFPEQEKSPRRLAHSKDHFSHKSTKRYGNRKAKKFYSTKCLTIDNWLHLQRNEPTTRTYTHRIKKVLAIPVPKKNNRCNGQNKAEILQCVKIHNHEVTKENIFNHDKIEKLVDVGVTGRSNTEVVIDEAWNSGSNTISPFIMTDEKVMEETQGLMGDLSIKDNGCSPIYPPEMQYDRLNQNKDYSGVTGMSSKQEVTDETQNMSDDYMFEDSGCKPSSPSDMENNIIKLKEGSHDPASKSELESGSQPWSTEIPNRAMVGPGRTVLIDDTVLMEITLSNGNMTKEYSDKGDLCACFQYMEGVTRPCLHTIRSCRTLFMDDEKQDPTASIIESQEKIHNTGICGFLGQKVQILCASALLGLGVQSLGLGHDFFYGLML